MNSIEQCSCQIAKMPMAYTTFSEQIQLGELFPSPILMPTVALSSASIASLHPSSIPENFKFADQNGQLYPCNLVIAQLLAPRVVELLSTDPTIDSFDIEVANEDDFCPFVSLLQRGAADFSLDHLASYISLSRQLGNCD
jgi:hypothetical protein